MTQTREQRPSGPSDQRAAALEAAQGLALTIRALSKRYGDANSDSVVHALRGVDLDVSTASFAAVMGPSGSGKSTLLQCAAGLDVPTAGRVFVGGTEVTGLDDTASAELRRSAVGFVFQTYNLMPTLTARQNIELPLRLAGARPDRIAVERVLDAVGLAGHADRRPAELSGGQRQRAAIARALLSAPRVLFADEPTGALDSRSARDVLGLLRDATDRRGQTTVMVTHDPIAASAADDVIFMADGQIVGREHHPSVSDIAARMAQIDAEESR